MTKDTTETVGEAAVDAAEPTEEELFDQMVAAKHAKPEDDQEPAPELEPEPETSSADAPESMDAEAPEENTDAKSDDPEALQKQNDKLKQQVKSEKGRARSLNMKHERLLAELREANARLETLQAAGVDKATQDKLNSARADYGDVLEPVLARQDQQDQANRRLAQIEKEKVAKLQSAREAHVREQEAVFLNEHPDAQAFMSEHKQAFLAWVDDQPREDRDRFELNRQAMVDGEAAALLLSNFKASIAPQPENRPAQNTSSKRQRQIAGAQSVRAASSQIVAADAEPTDENALFDYYVKKRRKRLGR